MLNGSSKKLVFILYDGLKNSVFVSQVLQPLLNQLYKNNNLEITLVSFEKERPSNEFLIKTIPAHDRLHLIIARRLPFFGKTSLLFAIYQLKKIFKFTSVDEIVARGPLAAWVAIKSIRGLQKDGAIPKGQKNILIRLQARGLCAQEYRFVYQFDKQNFIKKYFHKFVYYKLNQIETESYNDQVKKALRQNLNVEIEAVSPALKDYLVESFKVVPARVFIANKDLPTKTEESDRKFWKYQIRSELDIGMDDFVYCYSGSAKPWQCLAESIEFFCDQYKKNPKSFLLLLSQDFDLIEKIISEYHIPEDRYLLIKVSPDKLNMYLCACDAGLLFRDKDIINWVSRPTKMLEYQAAGLQVIHNHTIGWLERQQ
jgi:hypothetical protein